MAQTRRLTAAQREQRAAANAALVRHVVDEACQRGNLTVLDEVLGVSADGGSSHCHAQGPEAPPRLLERGRLREMLVAFRAAVSNADWTILEQVAAGETVVTRLQVRGHFSGALVRLAPPGRPATLTGVVVGRFEQGCLVELWMQADLLGLLQQLGLMPPLDLTQTAAMAQVQQAGALLAEEAAPTRSPGALCRERWAWT